MPSACVRTQQTVTSPDGTPEKPAGGKTRTASRAKTEWFHHSLCHLRTSQVAGVGAVLPKRLSPPIPYRSGAGQSHRRGAKWCRSIQTRHLADGATGEERKHLGCDFEERPDGQMNSTCAVKNNNIGEPEQSLRTGAMTQAWQQRPVRTLSSTG